MARRARSGFSQLAGGLSCLVGFGILWVGTGWFWPIWPMVFAGVMPTVSGLVRLYGRRSRDKEAAIDARRGTDKRVLAVAKEERGRVTPSMVALSTELSIEEADAVLTQMAQKGYASVQVGDDGRLEYQFQEFLPRSERDQIN